MATKLGEMLVEAGVLSPVQLEDALKSQAVFGGRLGTNLIEMGYLGENDLAGFLSRKLGLPCVAAEQLMSVPPAVIRLVPRELAEKYHIIPLGLKKKRLTLAMLDPSDLPLMDEISFITGYFIVPIIAPELRMVLALEKHYGIKPDARFVQAVEKIMESHGHGKVERREEKVREADAAAAPHRRRKIEEIIDACEEIIAPAAPAAVVPLIVEPVAVDQEKAEIAEPVHASPIPAGITSETLAERLAEAKGREEIADILTTHLAGDFNRVALFMIKGTVAEGWRAIYNKSAIPGIKELQISLGEPSVLKVVTEGKSFYLGAIPDTPENRRLLKEMGGNMPSSALLVPLMLMGRTVAIVYVEGGKAPLTSRLADLQKLVGKAAMAFEILILKNKILMT
jgi:hypothetical protein